MFNNGFPSHWSTLKKLIYLRGSPAGGGERYVTLTGNPVTFTARRAAPLKRLEVAIEPEQSGSGDPSPDNVRPITGWTGLNVWVQPTYDPTANPTVSVAFPDEAGTVYGGTLDVLTGVLTVDRVKITLTNSVSFNKVGTGSRVYFMLWASNSLFSGIRAKNNSTFISDKFTNVPSSTNAYNGRFTSDGSFQFYLDESITTGDAAKTWLGSNNVEIVYTLKDAQTYQLTTEEVSTLVGGNTIWTDAGQVTLEYQK